MFWGRMSRSYITKELVLELTKNFDNIILVEASSLSIGKNPPSEKYENMTKI